MIKVSRLADYAIMILATMAENETELISGAQLSRETALPEPTVAKVLKALTKAGVLTSVRGASGGYKLNKGPEEINIADIIVAVDGPIALTACVEGSRTECDYSCSCPVKGRWDRVNYVVRSALEGITLLDLMAKPASFSDVSGRKKSHGRV